MSRRFVYDISVTTTKRQTRKKKPVPPVRLVPLDEIEGWDDNPRTHDIPAITGSMGRWGYVEFMVRDSTSGKLVAGHGRLQTLTELRASGVNPPEDVVVGDDGTWQLWVREKAFENDHEARAYLIASNRTHDLGSYDDELGKFLKEFDGQDDIVKAMAYEDDIASVIARYDTLSWVEGLGGSDDTSASDGSPSPSPSQNAPVTGHDSGTTNNSGGSNYDLENENVTISFVVSPSQQGSIEKALKLMRTRERGMRGTMITNICREWYATQTGES